MTTRIFRAPANADGQPELDEFYSGVADADLQPLWTQQGLMPGSPPLRDVPFAWRWKRLRELAQRSGELVPIDRGGDRRVLALCNPGQGGAPFATSTLWAAVQYLGPGELAPAHRHTPSALRFVLEGSGVWTLVNGDPVAMSRGDLVLTGSWRWHEHHNPGDHAMLWFDGLDIPLVRALDAVFYEDGPDQPASAASDPVSRSERTYGAAAGLQPEPAEPAERAAETGLSSPLFAYRRADTARALDALQSARHGDARVSLRFVNPATGADVMPTMRCVMHRLRPGQRTATTRRAGSSVWVTYAGSAVAVIAGRRFEVAAGDMLAVPSWAPFDLEAAEPAEFFSISDAPVLEALGLARQVTMPAWQPVT
jgi:gentisate 1,2-dioxygenase